MADICGGKCLPARPDVQDLRDAIASEMSVRLFDGAPIIPGSNEDVVAYLLAGAVYESHGWANAALRETDPRCMCCDRLVSFARARGIYPTPAQAARGYVKLTGVAGTAIPYPLTMADTAGRIYETDATFTAAPAALDTNGEAVVRVVAQVPGEAGNADAGSVLYLSSPPPGIDSEAVVLASGLVGGAEEEDCEALRTRILERLKAGAVAANARWVMERIREWPGVTRVCVSTCGCVVPSYYVFMDGTYEPHGVPPAELLQEIEDTIFGHPQGAGLGEAPVGAKGRLPQAQAEPISVTIYGLSPVTPQVQDQVQTMIADVFRRMVCPGGCMCLRWLDDVLAGSQLVDCYDRIEVTPVAHSRIDGTDLCFDCDYFPVLDGVVYV